MIVFLESDKNDFTVYFNPPIRGGSVRLISCSLYNSWYNLLGGFVAIDVNNADVNKTIPNGHYTPTAVAKELAKHGYTLTTGLPHEITIKHNTPAHGWNWSQNPLAELLGIVGRSVETTAIPVKWKVPNSYEVHCSLVKTYDNGSFSNIMSKFPPKVNPLDLVEYTPIALTYELPSDLVENIQKDQSCVGTALDIMKAVVIIVIAVGVGYLIYKRRSVDKLPHTVSPYVRMSLLTQ